MAAQNFSSPSFVLQSEQPNFLAVSFCFSCLALFAISSLRSLDILSNSPPNDLVNALSLDSVSSSHTDVPAEQFLLDHMLKVKLEEVIMVAKWFDLFLEGGEHVLLQIVL